MKKIVILFVLFYVSSFSQISLTGDPYSQDFDSYAGTGGTIPSGWNVEFQSSSAFNGTGTGSSSTAGAWAYGSESEFSLGALRSGATGVITLSVDFTNNTGETINEITFDWNYEQWRYSNTSGLDVSGTGELDGNSSLNAEDFAGSSSGSDGIVSTTAISITLTSGISITDGQTFGLQWETTNLGGDDNGIAIDDFELTGPFPLPVELSSFSAVIVDEGIKLNWRTETELNNYGFEVERQVSSEQSAAGNWAKIGFVEGYGNSYSPKEYSFIDNNVISGEYAYRLKQIDNDGTFEYSVVIEVNAGEIPNGFVLEQNYPNPFNPGTKIKFSVNADIPTNLKVYDILGNEIAQLFNETTEAGKVYEIEFNAANLPSGVYFYKLETPTKILHRKMLLIK